MIKATVSLSANDRYRTAIHTGNHDWHLDMPVADGGDDTEPNPDEALLGALGSCMAMTAKLYAVRKGWPLEAVDVDLSIERYTGADYVGYTGDATYVYEVRENIVFHGPLTDEQLARLHDITTRCPVRRILSSPVFFVEPQPQR
jgi:putative redox protein